MNAPDTSWAKALLDAVADPDNPLVDILSTFRSATERLARVEKLRETDGRRGVEAVYERAVAEERDAKRAALAAAAKHFGEAVPSTGRRVAAVQLSPDWRESIGKTDWDRSGRAA